jgi:pilus assembly protein Flp/PilA
LHRVGRDNQVVQTTHGNLTTNLHDILDVFGDTAAHRVQDTTRGEAMVAVLAKLFRDQNGATAIEYAVIASLVSVAAFTFITNIGTSVTTSFENVANSL